MLEQSIGSLLLMAVLVMPAPVDAPLADAAMQGDLARVRLLLESSSDVNQAHGDGTTALHWAAYRDDLELARLLVEAGADASATTRNGAFTPLLMAARNGNAAMIKLLAEAGADARAVNENGTTALMLAAASGKRDAVLKLLELGVDPNATDTLNEQTAVMFAAATNAAGAIRLLANAGADLNARSTVIDPVGRNSEREGIDPNPSGTTGPWLGGLTALHFAAREGQIDAIRALVESGANVNVVAATDKMSSMTSAIINGSIDIAKYLLDRGADPNLVSTGGLGPLFATIDQAWAARTWYPAPSSEQEQTTHLELMGALIDAGADVNARMGPKLWFRATFHGDWVDPDGATPFWRAAQSNDIPVMKILVAAGADPNIPTRGGVTPLQVAAGFGYQPQTSNFAPDGRLATLRYLVEELKADVRARDNEGYTPLHGAALMNDWTLIEYLISTGADVTVQASMIYGRSSDTNEDVADGEGDSVADFANGPREWNLQYPEIVDRLVAMGSPFADNCKAGQCVQKTRPEPKRPTGSNR